MEAQAIPITIYSEMTPNPNTMKFVANKMLITENAVAEYRTQEEAKDSSPLAVELLNFPFVTKVFITRNFITVTKTDAFSWDDITFELRVFISEFLKDQTVAVIKVPQTQEQQEQQEQPSNDLPKPNANWSYQPIIKNEADQQIVDLLEEYVKPAVENDGGAIHFKSFENGVVTVILKGACSGCPSSTATLKGGVEQLLKSHIKEITEVIAEAQ